MTDLPLTLACWDYDRTRALADGRVRPEGIDLRYLPLEMPESFFRMLRFAEFEASEMSLSWYTRTVFSDPRPFQAIPVFPSRMFRHSCIYVNAASGIREPADLVGRKVGCPEYQMTAAVWIKGFLADEHGVPVNSVTYYTGGLEQPGRRETPMTLPDDISVVPIGDERTLSQMLEEGEIDALYSAHGPSPFSAGSPKVKRLFEDYPEMERDYYRRTGIFPIMHTVVVRQDVLDETPWVAGALTKAFEAARDLARDDLFEVGALKVMLPWLVAAAEETRELFGSADFWPYGLEPNRKALTTFLRYSFEQGLSPRQLEPEELFVPSTLLTAKK
ncbi:MAG: 4,5-dihydroxyphthalate decarboxylase [Thermoleophilaceae bacterium]|jgi:4,5-dihydroxyphthalate decarboxylase|nr:4,5-dihydroxyphthalate decarboxylase [Thermoleophilaceae bacterium]